MGIRRWFNNVITFVPPHLDTDEWERDPSEEAYDEWRDYDEPTFSRDTGEWRSGLRRVSMKTLEWTAAPPTKPGWYWVKRQWDSEYEAYHVLPGYEYPASGFLWCGPLPTPREHRP